MAPLTATRPKVMLPVANRPMIEHLICAVRDAGIDTFIIVVGFREKEIRDYFGDGEKWGGSQFAIRSREPRAAPVTPSGQQRDW